MRFFLRYFFALPAVLAIGVGGAQARDFGYEKFADVVSQVYGSQYGVVVPFFQMPDASDTTHQQEGYPGAVWNFAVTKGRNRGTIYTQGDMYCPPDPAPAPFANNTTRINNWLYRFEISGGGQFTVSGATPTDVIFQLNALDAQYITSYAIAIANTKHYYLPYNVLKDATSRAAAKCGPNFAYGLTSVIAGDVTIKVYFVAGVSSDVIFNIGSHIKANLHFKVEGKLGDSETNPVLVFTEGQQVFAISALPLPLK
jgi:hypothetical protein